MSEFTFTLERGDVGRITAALEIAADEYEKASKLRHNQGAANADRRARLRTRAAEARALVERIGAERHDHDVATRGF